MDQTRLEEIRSDAFAEDVPLPDLSVARAWTPEQAQAFFEAGGDLQAVPIAPEDAKVPEEATAPVEQDPAPPTGEEDPALTAVLEAAAGGR